MKNEQYENNKRNEFEVFYRKYYEGIYKYVYRSLLNVQAAEDITQETFYIAYVKREELMGHPQPQLWLLRTARNKMLEQHRRMKYRITVPLEEECNYGREELRYRLKELELTALATLSEEEWRTVKAYYLYGITISELAESKGISVNNMRVRLVRVKQKLREEIL